MARRRRSDPDAPPPMKLVVPRDRLEPALALALKAADAKNEVAILGHVLLIAGDEHLEVVACNLDVMLRIAIPAEVEARGSVTVDARTLQQAAKNLPEQSMIALAEEPGGARVRLACGRARYRLAALPAEDFPTLAVNDVAHAFEVEGKVLARALELTRHAVGKDEVRYYLNGVFLGEDAAGDLVFVATDGHRLARVSLPMPDDAGGVAGVILPRQSLAQIADIAAGMAGDAVEIEIGAGAVRFRARAVTFVTKLIDGTFPDYSKVIPADGPGTVLATVEAAALAASVARVTVVAAGKSRAVRLDLGESLTVLSTGTTGEAVDEVDLTRQGGELALGFNGVFLAELLGLVPAGDAVLHLPADAAGPVRITAEALDGVTLVLMPMRV